MNAKKNLCDVRKRGTIASPGVSIITTHIQKNVFPLTLNGKAVYRTAVHTAKEVTSRHVLRASVLVQKTKKIPVTRRGFIARLLVARTGILAFANH